MQLRGPSATSGYFHNPEVTARLFDGSWLNTGDLGYLAASELYLTGCEKDIIIRGGHNIHPQELEEAVSQIRGMRKGGVEVFPATDKRSGTEKLVVLTKTREKVSAEDRSRILTEINNLAVDLIGMPADNIVLAPPRTVLKTSSGKVRRAACREQYERGELISAQRAPLVTSTAFGWLRCPSADRTLAQARCWMGVERLGMDGICQHCAYCLASDSTCARAGATPAHLQNMRATRSGANWPDTQSGRFASPSWKCPVHYCGQPRQLS